jgi:hypothetical protein
MQNKGGQVSIAIPKAKKPVKYERVSPGVYRGSNGDLKRSAFNPTQSQGIASQIIKGATPKPGGPVSNGTPKEAIDAATKGIEAGLGGGSAKPRFMPGKGSLKDLFDDATQKPTPAGTGVPDDLLKTLRDVLGGMGDGRDRRDMFNPLVGAGNIRPAPRPNMRDIDPGFAVDPADLPGSLYDLVRTRETPQIPRASGSIADMLRRR